MITLKLFNKNEKYINNAPSLSLAQLACGCALAVGAGQAKPLSLEPA
jgi:hypothetical protein